MKVVIYIGHHKVGSTSLQVFLSQNSHQLLQNGILYPYVEMRGAAYALLKAAGRGDQVEELPANIREPHSALAYKMMTEVSHRPVPKQFQMLPHQSQMFHALRMQVITLKPKAVVLCSEAFSNFGAVDPVLVNQLRNVFAADDSRVYCALRRPDDYIVSWQGQRIKVGEKTESLQYGGLSQYFATIHFDYRLAVDAWIGRSPAETMVLRNYSDILASGGSEVDFMQHSGVEFPNSLIPNAIPANKSLPTALHEVVRLANAALTRGEAFALTQFLLQKHVQMKLPANGDVEMLGAENRNEMYRRFIPIHDYLCRVSGKDAFFPDLDAMLSPRPIPESEAMRLALDSLDPETLQDLPSDNARNFLSKLRNSYCPS